MKETCLCSVAYTGESRLTGVVLIGKTVKFCTHKNSPVLGYTMASLDSPM
jgi:hypothetical protein